MKPLNHAFNPRETDRGCLRLGNKLLASRLYYPRYLFDLLLRRFPISSINRVPRARNERLFVRVPKLWGVEDVLVLFSSRKLDTISNRLLDSRDLNGTYPAINVQ